MADRFNKCTNPYWASTSNTTTGFVVSTGAAPTRSFWDQTTSVPRRDGWQFPANSSVRHPPSPLMGNISGQTWTVSLWARRNSGGSGVTAVHTIAIEWLNSSGGTLSTSSTTSFNVPGVDTAANTRNGVRMSRTVTAPANAFGLRAVVATTSTASSWQTTAILYEQAGSAGTYFDGTGDNTPAPTFGVNVDDAYSWDGTATLSASKFTDVPAILDKPVTDSFTMADNAAVSVTDSSVDTFTFGDVATLTALPSVSDTFTLTESASIEQFAVPKSATDTFTLTETATIAQTFYPTATDDATLVDTATVSASMLASETHSLTETSDITASIPRTDSATQTESASINVLVTDTATTTEQQVQINQSLTDQFALIEQVRIGVSGSDSATLTETVVTGHYATDSATLSERVVINVITSDSATQTDSANLTAFVVSDDQGTLYDEIKKLRTEPFPTEDPLINREPAFTKRRAPFRILAQDIFTKRFIHMDVPILGDPTLTYTLSGPNMFQAVLNYEAPSLQNLEFPLEPYKTWLHVEEDDVIRQSTLLQPFVDDNKSRQRIMEGEGFTWYPKELVYQGEPYEGVQVDPASMIRKIWQHIKEYWTDLGIDVSSISTPVRIGVAKKNVEFETEEGENVSFQAGPYDLNWWEVTNLGSEIEKLLKETPMEYIETSYWNSDRTDVKHLVDLNYPRVGTRREDIYFQEGMNLTELIPKRNENKDVWKSDIIVIGAGEGAKAIRGYASENTGRLRRAEVLENQDITDLKRAQAIADFEKQRRRRSRYTLDAITINANHSNAPWGSFQQGDDILVEGTVIYDGRIADWNRITSYTYKPKAKRALLSLSPSESFTYGAIPEVD